MKELNTALQGFVQKGQSIQLDVKARTMHFNNGNLKYFSIRLGT